MATNARRVGLRTVFVLIAVMFGGWPALTPAYAATGASLLTGISCPRGSVCFAVGNTASGKGYLERSTDRGRDWARLSDPAPRIVLAAVSCADTQHCVAVGGRSPKDALFTSDGGVDWNVRTLPTFGFGVTSVWCVDRRHCLVAEDGLFPNGNHVDITADGGATWNASSPIAPAQTDAENLAFTSITCAALDECLAVGDETVWMGSPVPVPVQYPVLASSTDGGTSWQTQTLPGSPVGVSCLTTEACVAVGTDGVVRLATTNAGDTWTATTVAIPGLNTWPDAVSCADSLHCTAVALAPSNPPPPADETPIVTTDDGGSTWSVHTTAAGELSLRGVSCPNIRVCWAAGSTIPANGGDSTGPIVLRAP